MVVVLLMFLLLFLLVSLLLLFLVLLLVLLLLFLLVFLLLPQSLYASCSSQTSGIHTLNRVEWESNKFSATCFH